MNQSTMSILMLVLIIVVMYFLLIRPQKKKEKAINEMRNAIKAGDEIVTIGGICGKIVKTKDESLVIQVGADKVKFEIMRWAVSKVVSESSAPAPAAAEEEAEPKKPSRPKCLIIYQMNCILQVLSCHPEIIIRGYFASVNHIFYKMYFLHIF